MARKKEPKKDKAAVRTVHVEIEAFRKFKVVCQGKGLLLVPTMSAVIQEWAKKEAKSAAEEMIKFVS